MYLISLWSVPPASSAVGCATFPATAFIAAWGFVRFASPFTRYNQPDSNPMVFLVGLGSPVKQAAEIGIRRSFAILIHYVAFYSVPGPGAFSFAHWPHLMQ
jgi:hypothetical protein